MTTTPQQIDLWRQAPTEDRRLEFKEARNQYGFGKLCEYCVAIANEEGGYLLLGISDRPPRPVGGTRAFQNPVKTEGQLFQKLGFRVEVEAVSHPEGRVLVFHIPSRPPGEAYHLDGKYLMRVGESLVAMTGDQLRRIFAEERPDWNQHSYASALVTANLLGAWDENNAADCQVIRQLADEDFDSWIRKIQEIVQHSASPVTLNNGLWRVSERKSLWQALGSRVFDVHLENLRGHAVAVLSERDPQFELPPPDRNAAQIRGKVLRHSSVLRKGLAQSLALLGTQPPVLVNCSQHKPENTAILATREIFATADWVLWGSVDRLLPTLAEAAPDEFLSAVEQALRQSACPFDELFSQEGDGIFGGIYHAGLLWALETLAWDAEFFVRVCVILGELASRDPGGNRGNRPANSLATILLPWLPQTTASIEKRQVALQTLQREFPAVAWRLLLNLLPERHQTSLHTRKPAWRKMIPEDWTEGVSTQEYWRQVSSYADMTVEMASNDMEKLKELIDRLDKLTPTAFDKVLEYLSSEAISNQPEVQRADLWEQLTIFAQKHRSFPDAKWSLPHDTVSKIEDVAAQIIPVSPSLRHRIMFIGNRYDLYPRDGDLDRQMKRLEERRLQAVKEILTYGGVDAVVQFAEAVKQPDSVGNLLGVGAGVATDDQILPALLQTDSEKLTQFVGSYVWSRHKGNGWEWVDGLDRSHWSGLQVGRFLSYLPFTADTWERVADWLGENERVYWETTQPNSFVVGSEAGFGIDKLIDYGRPKTAIRCFEYKNPIDSRIATRALIAALTSTEQFQMDPDGIVWIIKALQDDPTANPDDLFRIEWEYLRLLDRHYGVAPKTLENRLASDPAFFCEIMRLRYPSIREGNDSPETTREDWGIAGHIWWLLQEWRTPPGKQPDGTFAPDLFRQWLAQVKEICGESEHLEVALNNIGQVLIHCPPDPDRLWIHHSAAQALNDVNAEKMRDGYNTGVFNSRGAHAVDPTGKPERELAERWRKKAEDVENAGYQRFATTLRRLAEGYDREAERIVAEHDADE